MMTPELSDGGLSEKINFILFYFARYGHQLGTDGWILPIALTRWQWQSVLIATKATWAGKYVPTRSMK
jgi:hypothetical protein